MAGRVEMLEIGRQFPELDGTIATSIRNRPSVRRLATRLRDAHSRGALYIVPDHRYQSNYFFSKVSRRAPRGSTHPKLTRKVPKGSIVVVQLSDASDDDAVALVAQRDSASADFEPRMASKTEPGDWRLLISPFGTDGPDVLRACGFFCERLGRLGCIPLYRHLAVVKDEPASSTPSRSSPVNLSRVPMIETTHATRSNSRASHASMHSSGASSTRSSFRLSSLRSGPSVGSLRPESRGGMPLLHTAASSTFEEYNNHPSRTSSPAFSYDGRPPSMAPNVAGPVKPIALDFRTPSGGSYTKIGSTTSSQVDRSASASPILQPRQSGSLRSLSRRTPSIASELIPRATDSPPFSRPGTGSRDSRASSVSSGSSFGIFSLFANTAQTTQAALRDSTDDYQQASSSRSTSTRNSSPDLRKQSRESISPPRRTPPQRPTANTTPSRPISPSSENGMRSFSRPSASSSTPAPPQSVGTKPSIMARWNKLKDGGLLEHAHLSLDRRWGDPARNNRTLRTID